MEESRKLKEEDRNRHEFGSWRPRSREMISGEGEPGWGKRGRRQGERESQE